MQQALAQVGMSCGAGKSWRVHTAPVRLAGDSRGRAARGARLRTRVCVVRHRLGHTQRLVVQAIVLRVCFILGNLTEGSDECRARIARDAGAVPMVHRLLALFLGAARDRIEGDGKAPDVADVVDTLAKGVRIVAHLAIDPAIGGDICARPDVVVLLDILGALPPCARASASLAVHLPSLLPSSRAEAAASWVRYSELLLNAVSAVTNLSYHSSLRSGAAARGGAGGGGDVLEVQAPRIARALVPLLVHDSTDVVRAAASVCIPPS